jgi:ketosteroid isomerase-like protein
MAPRNVEVVRGLIDASGRGDLDAVMAALDPEVVWTPVESDPDYRVHRGSDDVRAWLVEWGEALPDMHWEAERILDAGGGVVLALVRAVGTGAVSGLDVGTPTYAVVFEVRSDRIVEIREYADRSEALEAAGLRE